MAASPDPSPPAAAARRPGWLRQFGGLLKDAFLGTWRELRRGWPWYLGIFALACILAWTVLQPRDDEWMSLLRHGGKPPAELKNFAQAIGSTGDELQFNFAVFLMLWFLPLARRRDWWRKVAVASLAAMVISGLVCNVLRPSFGRPRPSTQSKQSVEDGIYPGRGFLAGHAYQSFPSAHTATAFGTATAVFVANPLAGAPFMVYAGGMAWARTVQNSHHPSDVFAGAALGILAGVAAGRWAGRSKPD